MKSKKCKNTLAKAVLKAALLSSISMGFSSASYAIAYDLCAKQENVTMPDGVSVPMWGYAVDSSAGVDPTCAADTIQVPGPALVVPPGDSVLTINVRNVGLSEPTSIVIPGQDTVMTPVMFTPAGATLPRVRSFTHETAAGAVGTYSWTNMQPGTYAYQSGTHPAVQIQMGLYGSVTKEAGAVLPLKAAYPGIAFDNEMTLLYSEVDPVLHNEVAAGTYGTTGMTSTIHYNPQYFLVNGADSSSALLPPGLSTTTSTLIRFINMGLTVHVPVMHGSHFKLIAEDGHAYTYPRRQYSVTVGAGQTRDVLFTPATLGNYAMFDRILNLTNKQPAATPPGGVVLAAATTASPTATSPGSLFTMLQVGTHSDADTILDHLDNCLLKANSSQIDADNDGFGNACDGDFNNDGIVNTGDLVLFANGFFTTDALRDINGDGIVNVGDLVQFSGLFFQPPGPSGINP